MTPKEAISAIDEHGVLLVFPIANASDPRSLWSVFHPKKKLRWEWDDGADSDVVDLWHLRTRLSTSGKVVYTKWLRGRATFFSVPVFRAMLARFSAKGDLVSGLSPDARDLLSIIEDDSPVSTKELKKRADLRGREREGIWNRALGSLFARLLVVGWGEVEDGAFPSLAVGATNLLFEDAWAARDRANAKDERALDRALASSKAFERTFTKTLASL